jgi:hypothetical protein
MPSRRHVRRAALITVAAAAAVGAGLAVRAARRKPGTGHRPPAGLEVPSRDRPIPAATRVPRNWAGVIAGLQLPFIWVFAAAPESGWMLPVDIPEPTRWLQPGDEADQMVAFDVNTNARLARFRLGLEPSIVDRVLS